MLWRLVETILSFTQVDATRERGNTEAAGVHFKSEGGCRDRHRCTVDALPVVSGLPRRLASSDT